MSEDVLSDAFFDARERDLKKRLKPKRFEHARGVSKTAASLAETYGVDVRKARLAGLLHDWDKEYGDDEIRERARALGVDVDPYVLDMIIYIADAIEPSRDFDGLDELRAAIGAVPLEELFMMTFNHILLTLVERRRRLHPATVEVWNHYVARSRDAKAEKGTA